MSWLLGPSPYRRRSPRSSTGSARIGLGARQLQGEWKVTRSALENAASGAALVLTTESLVTDIPEPPAPMSAPPPEH